MTSRPRTPARQLTIVGASANGRPRTYRLVDCDRRCSRSAAYRRLALAILGLDVASLAAQLSGARRGN